jgi:predicted nucleic acid-binding Zn ribbon protein
MHARRETAQRTVLPGRRDPHGAERRVSKLLPAQAGGEKLCGILRRTLEENGMARRLPRRVAPEVWESAVGAQIAARAQPTVLSGGTLHLLVQDHRWRDQLDAARELLLERLNGKLGDGAVRALQFGLAHQGALDQARRRAGFSSEPTPRRAVEPSGVLGASRLDPTLREGLLRAAEAAQRRRP